MKALTIKDLHTECQRQIKLGNGNKTIMISQDDEGNGYHYLWYSFAYGIEELNELEECGVLNISENVAKKEDTILLG